MAKSEDKLTVCLEPRSVAGLPLTGQVQAPVCSFSCPVARRFSEAPPQTGVALGWRDEGAQDPRELDCEGSHTVLSMPPPTDCGRFWLVIPPLEKVTQQNTERGHLQVEQHRPRPCFQVHILIGWTVWYGSRIPMVPFEKCNYRTVQTFFSFEVSLQNLNFSKIHLNVQERAAQWVFTETSST